MSSLNRELNEFLKTQELIDLFVALISNQQSLEGHFVDVIIYGSNCHHKPIAREVQKRLASIERFHYGKKVLYDVSFETVSANETSMCKTGFCTIDADWFFSNYKTKSVFGRDYVISRFDEKTFFAVSCKNTSYEFVS